MSDRYSLSRAILDAVQSGGRGPRGGLEREVSDEIAQRTNRAPKGFYVPVKRSLNTAKGAGALNTITTPPTSFVDALRSRMVTAALGTHIGDFGDGSRGSVDIPKVVNAGQVQWVAEDAAPSDPTGLTLDGLSFTPHTVTGYTDVTRKMIHCAAPGFDAYVLGNLARGIGQEVDRVALVASGEGNEPMGLLGMVGVPLHSLGANGGPVAREDVLAMEQALGNANADGAFVGLVTTPNGRAKMRATGDAGERLWGDDNRVLGYPAMATTAMPSFLTKGSGTDLSALILGDWSSLYVNLFGAVDLQVDPFTFATSGTVRLTAFLDVDIQVAHVEAFQAIKDFDTTTISI